MIYKLICRWLTVVVLVSSMAGCTSSSEVNTETVPVPVEGNLLPGALGEGWHSWSPREEITPLLNLVSKEGIIYLDISSEGKFENFGKWICEVPDIKGGDTYGFSVDYKPEKVENEGLSIYAMLTWQGSDGKAITRDYVTETKVLENGWKAYGRILDAPSEAVSLTVELCLRWSEKGRVQWRNPSLVKAEPVRHRKVKVATTLVRAAYDTLEENLARMLEVIDMAGNEAKPDVICLSESVYDFETNLPIEKRAETIPGKLTDAISKKARQYRTYIVFSMLERDQEKYYQTGVLIGRNGEIAGKYRKTHIPLSEAEYGYTPGNEYPVFDTDFGKVGIMICWDHWFPEAARILRSKGAEIIFLPTQGNAAIQEQARAVDNSVYLVVSGYVDPKNSKIINPLGQVIKTVTKPHSYVEAEIDLDQRFYQNWLSVGPCNGEGRSVYIKERREETYDELLGE